MTKPIKVDYLTTVGNFFIPSIIIKLLRKLKIMLDLTGSKVPSVTFKTRAKNDDGDFDWKSISSDDIFKGSTHLPGYEANFDDIKATGVDDIYCLSVNDSFVMNAWGKDQGVKNVKLIPDGSGEFSRGMGMLVKKENLGFGMRSWRYSMVVNDGVVEKMFIEDGQCDNFESDPFEVSDANTMLEYLEANKK